MKSNTKHVGKVGFVAKTSQPLPTQLLQVSLFQQPYGSHPGRKPGDHTTGRWMLERGKELVELVTKGRGWIRTQNDKWKEVTPGALIWHIPGDQTIGRSDWDDPFHCLAVVFTAPSLRGVRRAPRLAWWKDMEAVQRFSRELVYWFLDERIDRSILLHHAYGRLLFQSHLWQRIEEHSELPLKLREAADWMTQHSTSKFSLGDVAKMVGWSVPHLHEMFRIHLEVTPHQFVLNRRIRIAKQRLATTDDPIKQLASDCGFSTTPIFCSTFKARVGLTPLAYRKQERDWIRH